jgi:hypothetical protein
MGLEDLMLTGQMCLVILTNGVQRVWKYLNVLGQNNAPMNCVILTGQMCLVKYLNVATHP